MIDWSRIAGFDWDEGNLGKNSSKHGVIPAEAEQLFANEPLIVTPDLAHSGGEERFQALGKTNTGRLLFAAFTLRQEGARVRVISVRDMHIRERRRYGQET
jgi:uncharacterized protein